MNTQSSKKASGFRTNRGRIFLITFLGITIALSIALIYHVHFPIFPVVDFLEYDPGDIPIIIATAFFGPAAGLAVTAAASIVQGLTVSAQSGVYGIIMHIIATGTYVLVFGLIDRKRNELPRQIIAAVTAALSWTVMMFFANLIVTPAFTGWPVSAVMEVMPFILAFNLIKASVNSVVALTLNRTLGNILRRRMNGAAR